jgi:hypothetical protein
MIELAKDERHQDVAGGDGRVRVVSLDGLEAGEGAVVIEIVEVLVSLADLSGEVDGVGVGGGIIGVREGWGGQQKREKEEAESFDAAFYGSSPKPWTAGLIANASLVMQMIGSDAAGLLLDALPGTLYPLVPGNPPVPLYFI